MIWIFRTDKIGDSVLSLPLDELVQGREQQVLWFLSPATQFLAKFAEPPRLSTKLSTFWELLKKARRERPEVAVVLHAPWWVSFALWLSRVPIRSGRLSQWHSFLFFNRGVRQNRSQPKMHELEYGAELIRAALISSSSPQAQSLGDLYLKLREPSRSEVSPGFLEKWQVQAKNYYVVHPGMAGSARNWEGFSNLLEALTKKTQGPRMVVITGTAADQIYLSGLEARWKNHPQVRWTVAQLNSSELLAILGRALAVIAPSTGVLHLSSSLGVPSVGLYSPIQTHHPKRWGPRGPRSSFLIPNVECKAVHSCLGTTCPDWDCMKKIEVPHIISELEKWNAL